MKRNNDNLITDCRSNFWSLDLDQKQTRDSSISDAQSVRRMLARFIARRIACDIQQSEDASQSHPNLPEQSPADQEGGAL